MKLTLSCFSLAAAASLTAPVLQAQEAGGALTIKPEWQAGKRYVQTVTTEAATTMDFGGAKAEQKMHMVMGLSNTVKAGTPEKLVLKYESVHMDLDGLGQKVSFDSAKPETASDAMGLGKGIKDAMAGEYTFILNADDTVKEMEAGATGAKGAKTAEMFFGKDALLQMSKAAQLGALPKGPVKPGDSWPFKIEQDLSGMGKVSIEGKYTFKSTSEHGGVRCAELVMDAKSDLSLNSDAAAKNPQLAMLAALGLKSEGGTVTGTTWYDTKLNFCRESEMILDLKLSMNNPDGSGKKTEMPVKQKTVQKLEKVEDAK